MRFCPRFVSKATFATHAGFTLIEILVVVVILSVLAAIIIPNFAGRPDEARVAKAKSDIASFRSTLATFQLDLGRYPTEDEGLAVLREPPATDDASKWKGPYITKSIPKDPWGEPYIYYSPAPNGIDGFGIESYGADRQPGGEGVNADINSWSDEEDTQQ